MWLWSPVSCLVIGGRWTLEDASFQSLVGQNQGSSWWKGSLADIILTKWFLSGLGMPCQGFETMENDFRNFRVPPGKDKIDFFHSFPCPVWNLYILLFSRWKNWWFKACGEKFFKEKRETNSEKRTHLFSVAGRGQVTRVQGWQVHKIKDSS